MSRSGPLGNPEQGRKLSVDIQAKLSEPVLRLEVHVIDQRPQSGAYSLTLIPFHRVAKPGGQTRIGRRRSPRRLTLPRTSTSTDGTFRSVSVRAPVAAWRSFDTL
ncbi:MAG: hypothetical protein AB1942_19645 [Pseudomonadota bacterium]